MILTARLCCLVVATIVLSLSGCPREQQVQSPIDARIAAIGEAFNRYSAADQQMIRSGRFRIGLDELAVYLAAGQPALYWNTNVDGTQCRVLVYAFGEDTSAIDAAVYTCGGMITHVARIQPALPCWRLASVAPRITEQADYFDGQPLGRQWEIVAGVLRRGQAAMDVYIGFGRPYNTGTEAREDGTDAQSQVFLDGSDQAYGLYITLVDNRVVGWRIPAERTLTPEAEQRRLEATEERLMAQLRRMEEQAIEQHREEVALLNQIQSQGDQIIDRLDTQARQAIVQQSASAASSAQPPPGGGPGGEGAGSPGAPPVGTTPATDPQPEPRPEPRPPAVPMGMRNVRMGERCTCQGHPALPTCLVADRRACGDSAAYCAAPPGAPRRGRARRGQCTRSCESVPCPEGFSCIDIGNSRFCIR